tara:strand:- start:65 stop:3361 length:3297 start_codon:yes stop_codon:yes gene_type:complete
MGQFNDRVFGANIHPSVKNKLKARQIFAQSSEPNQSIIGSENVFTRLNGLGEEIEDSSITPSSILGGINFSTPDGKGSLADLSSRTPWVRMWTAVQLYYYEESKTDISTKTPDFIYEAQTGNVRSTPADGYDKIKNKNPYTGQPFEFIDKKMIQNELQIPMDGRVYSIGNHIFNNATDLQNPNDTIFEGSGGSVGNLSSKDFGIAGESQLKTEMQTNEFFKPPAGITSVTSETEGTLGAIRRTTVNFIVQNFTDFENIYLKYFLRPGALIVVDFGWDTSGIYDPQKEIVETKKPLKDSIYGDGQILENSNGDLEVVIGSVVDYSAKAREDGGFECSLQIVSTNEGLVDKELSDRNQLRNKFVSELSTIIINRAAKFLGKGFLRNDWNSSSGIKEESDKYARSFGESVYGTGDSKVVDISSLSLASGVYWQALDEGGKSIRGSNNVYISWAFFEEELLNKDLGLVFEDDFKTKFDSSQTFVSLHENLVKRQNIEASLSGDKVNLKFLYPPNWSDTYFTKNAKRLGYTIPKRPEEFDTSDSILGGESFDLFKDGGESYVDDQFNVVTLDKNAKRIPLRELFINLTIIEDAFKTNNSVNDAIVQILDVLNEDSFNVFNLKLTTGTRDFSTLAVVDENRNFKRDDGGESLFNEPQMFTFNPYSPNSIVKSMDLSYSTPKGNVQNMIAIQNTDMNIPLFINSEQERIDQTLRQILSDDNVGLGIRYLPNLQDDFAEKDGAWKDVSEQQTQIKSDNIVKKTIEEESIVKQYQNLLYADNISSFDEEQLTEDAEKLENFEVDLNKENSPIGTFPIDGENQTMTPNTIFAKDLEEYFRLKCKTDFHENKKVSIPTPISLTLTTHGISSIMPGDIFSVDYLPKNYRESVYFKTTKVSQNISPESWSTTLETEMLLKPKSQNINLYKKPKKISLSPSFFTKLFSEKIGDSFTNFDLTDKTTNSVFVFSATGLQKGLLQKNFEWKKEGNFNKNLLKSETGVFHRSFFNMYFVSDSRYNRGLSTASLDGYDKFRKVRHQLWLEFDKVPINKRDNYTILSFLGGVIVLNNKELKGNDIQSYVKSIDEAIQHHKLFRLESASEFGDVTWKKR